MGLLPVSVLAIAPGKVVVIKKVINDNGGSKVSGDFTIDLYVKDITRPASEPMVLWSEFPGPVSPGTTFSIGATSYKVTETPASGYTAYYSSDCEGSVSNGEVKTCTVTNNDQPPKVTVIKNVVGGSKTAGDFVMQVYGRDVTRPADEPNVLLAEFPGSGGEGTTVNINAGSYEVKEIVDLAYTTTFSEGCSGTASVGQNISCTVTNTFKNSEGGSGGGSGGSGGSGGTGGAGGTGGGGGGGGLPVTSGSISGSVYNDINTNQVKDGTDTGLSGFTVFLDANDNGQLDSGEATALSGANGAYVFSGIPFAIYNIRVVAQPGWSIAFPTLASGNKYTVNVSSIQPNHFVKDFALNNKGVILGASTGPGGSTAPGASDPAILGAVTELPRTGLPASLPALFAGLGIAGFLLKKKKFV